MPVSLDTAIVNHIVRGLAPDVMTPVLYAMRPVSLNLGDLLCDRGDDLSSIYFPFGALLSVTTPLLDGQAIETAIVGCEGCVGLVEALGRVPSFSRVVCQSDGSGAFIDRERHLTLAAEFPSYGEACHRGSALLLAQAQQSAGCHGHHPVEARLCRWLMMALDRAPDRETFPFTQQFLAEMLGAQRTTVNTVAGDLQDQGVIAYSRGKIRILDRAKLMKMSCECYGALKEYEEQLSIRAEAARLSQFPLERRR